MRRIAVLVLALAVPLASVVSSQGKPDNSAAARQAITAADANWARLTAAGHSDSLADFYVPDALVMPPNMSAVHGRVAIREYFGSISSMSSPPPVITLHSDSVWSAGAWALDLGRWTWVWPAGAKIPAGEMPADSGKYMARWVQEKGKWLIAQVTWSSDVLVPPPVQH
jgi:ketosteroid isomerase-like protein